ncbi:MAG: hemerythrin family protein [Deltaproteobacteria bacterium]|nr:hemerythrin family protein [Deltaproteobacteria bacterium]
MTLEWKKDFLTGLYWQDEQHKELFKRADRFVRAVDERHAALEALELFAFLDEYIVTHLDAEEQAMTTHNYPAVIEHLAEHTAFIEDVARLKKQLTTTNAADCSIALSALSTRVCDWFFDHITTVDKEMGEFIRKAEARTRAKA